MTSAERDPEVAAPTPHRDPVPATTGRIVSLTCVLHAAAAAAWLIGSMEHVVGACIAFAMLQGLAMLGLRHLAAWRHEPTAMRCAIALGTGLFATWLAMHLSSVRYDDQPPMDQGLWQYLYGNRKNGAEEVVHMPSVVAGFPLFGIGGTDGKAADIDVARPDLPPLPRQSAIVIVWGSPLHMKLQRGIGLLWANWMLLTLAAGLATLAIPTHRLVVVLWPAALLGWIGFALGIVWQGHHGYY